MIYLVLFVLGLFLGSFLNVVADRLLKDQDFIKGRSKCDSCGTELSAWDLIPLISYIVHGGKCSYCSSSLSIIYPISEFITGLALILAYILSAGSWIHFVFIAVILSLYVIVVLTDLKEQLILDKVVGFGILFTLFWLLGTVSFRLYETHILLNSEEFGKYLIQAGLFNSHITAELLSLSELFATSGIIYFFFMFLIFITKGRGMGAGDMKLSFLIGLVNGAFLNFLAIFLGFFIGSLFSIFYIILGKKGMKDVIPFGPFMVIGSVVTLLYGEELLRLYLSTL